MNTLDKTDWLILRAVQADGKLSSQDIAEQVGMSAAACWRRLKALESAGTIKAYRAIVDRARIDLEICAFVNVSINQRYKKVLNEVESALSTRPEIMECYATTGDSDFTLKVVARDIDDYNQFLKTFLFELPGVGQVRSSIALSEIKYTTEYPVSQHL